MIRKLLAHYGWALVTTAHLDELNYLLANAEEDRVKLGDRLIAMSRENEKPRCDSGCIQEIDALKAKLTERERKIKALRVKVIYYKRRAKHVPHGNIL